jgi:hypothetical protein
MPKDWDGVLLDAAIEKIARRRLISKDDAWADLRTKIAEREIEARCRAIWKPGRDTQGQPFLPEWLSLVAAERPEDNRIRFRAPGYWHTGECALCVTEPPQYARDIEVDAARLDALYPDEERPETQPVHLAIGDAAQQAPSPAAREFLDPFWSVRQIIGWLIDRDPRQFSRLFDRTDLLAQLRYKKPAEGDHDPLRTLLNAFQEGRLLGVRKGKKVSAETWATTTIEHLRGDVDTRVWRGDVLRLWPEAAAVAANAAAAGAPDNAAETRREARPTGDENKRFCPKTPDEIWSIAVGIMLESDQSPKRGHGRQAALARLVNAELKLRGNDRYEDDSIRKMISLSFHEWKQRNPDK